MPFCKKCGAQVFKSFSSCKKCGNAMQDDDDSKQIQETAEDKPVAPAAPVTSAVPAATAAPAAPVATAAPAAPVATAAPAAAVMTVQSGGGSKHGLIPFCTKCGKQIPENFKFCTSCGTPVAPAATPMAAQTVENLSLWGYFIKCWKNYANFEGRARRKEYWGFALFLMLTGIGLGILVTLIAVAGGENGYEERFDNYYNYTFFFFGLVTLLPSSAVLVRRIHDLGYSGWNALPLIAFDAFSLIDILHPMLSENVSLFLSISWIICMIVLGCPDGKAKENEYGPNPK